MQHRASKMCLLVDRSLPRVGTTIA